MTDLETNETHALGSESMYALERHQRHRLDARTDMRLVCVFTPALVGPETPDEDGSCPLL